LSLEYTPGAEMKTRTFSLADGEPRRLRIEYVRSFLGKPRSTSVFLDGAPLARTDGESLNERLPDGSALALNWIKTFHGYELHLVRDGAPVPGSEADPQQRLLRLANLLYVVAGLTIAVSALALFGGASGHLGLGVPSALEGAVVAVLGYLIGRRSRVALALAIALIGLDLAFSLTSTRSGPPPAGSILVHGYLLWSLIGGFKDIRAAENRPRSALSP
jgi:hypothetical protein